MECHISLEVTYSLVSWNFPRSQPGSHISWEVLFPGMSHFPGSNISREDTFPGKSHCPRRYYLVSRNFPGSQLSLEVNYHVRIALPGSHEWRWEWWNGGTDGRHHQIALVDLTAPLQVKKLCVPPDNTHPIMLCFCLIPGGTVLSEQIIGGTRRWLLKVWRHDN